MIILAAFRRRSLASFLSALLIASGLQFVAGATPANAATVEPYGLNYRNAYFNVSGGLAPSGSNFQVDSWFRINDMGPGEKVVIIGNSGSGMILKVVGTNEIYLGQAWTSAVQFTCQTTWVAETWYQLTVVQDANGQLAWINGASCGTKQNRSSYSGASQVGGQSSPERLTSDGDIASLRFMTVPTVSTTSSTITVPSYPLANVANTTFLLQTNTLSVPMYDSTGKTLTRVNVGGGSIRSSQTLLTDQTISFSQPANMTYGASNQVITASATSGLSVALASTTPSVCTIVSGAINIVSPGTCTITANQAGNTTYKAAAAVSKSITISSAASTIAVTGSSSFTYNGSAQGPSTASVTGSSGSVTYSYAGSGATTYGPSATRPTSPGSYTATATVAANTNYSSATSTAFAFVIAKVISTISMSGSTSFTYSGLPQGPSTSSVTGSTGTVTYSYEGTGSTSYTASATKPTNAGTYLATATVATDATFQSATSTTYAFTISKANQATLTMANQSLWAHQNAYPTTWVPTAPGSGTGELVFNKISGPCTISGGVLSGNPTGPSGPKVCTYTVTRAADTNYNATTSAEFTVTMAFSFSKIGLALPSGATTATYGTPVQITATSFGQIPGKITFRAGGQIISGCSDQSVTAAPWTTTCSWTPSQSGSISLTSDWVPLDTNTYDSKINSHPYKLATDPTATTTPVTIAVNKIATNISIALNSPTSTYGSVNTITATTSVPGSVTFKTNHFDPIPYCTDVATTLTSPYTAQCDWFPITVATRPLSADLTPQDTAAYASSASNSVMTTSGKAQITITPTAGQSKRYGESNQAITYSITSGALVGSDTLSGSLTYTGTNVGSYTITRGTLTHTKYDITLAPEVFEITAATQSAVSLLSVSSTFNPANKTVLLSGAGGSSSGTYSFALDPSNATDGTDGCSVTGSTLTYTSVGICLVTVTRSSDSNFLTRSDVISVSIGTATQTITFGSLSAKEYSGDTFTVSATSSASLPVVFTSVSQSVCTTSGSYGSTIKLLGVGTCVINANQIGDGNVAAASQVSQNFDVNPRTITVTADAKSKNYGTNDPTLTYSVTTGSLVLGDSLTGMLSRAAGSDAGNYQIQQGSLTTGNNPKYAINFVGADLTIDRVTPSLVLSYPNSNVAILRPGATVTPALTTSSSSGALSFATTSASSICTVDSATGVISLFGAGNCAIAMSTAQTTNFIAHTQTTTLTVALLSTSLVGIDPSDLISMGQPFYSHPVINQSYSFSSGNNGASVSIPAGTLDSSVPISVSLLTDSAEQRALIGGTGTSVLSVVVSWVASDGSVPNTNTGKAISVTLTNPEIKAGAKIYSIIGDRSQLLGTATVDGSVTTLITEDPVLLVINPVAIAQPVVNVPVANSVETAAAITANRVADAALNPPKKITPQLSLYTVSSSLQLSAYDKAALKKYVSTLKNGTSVKCIGYSYAGKVSKAKATKLAKNRANSVCNLMKGYKKDLKTSIVIYDAKKAPAAAKGAKWVGVSFRIDGTTK